MNLQINAKLAKLIIIHSTAQFHFYGYGLFALLSVF